jgi:N-acetylglucosamine-6-sulfatase
LNVQLGICASRHVERSSNLSKEVPMRLLWRLTLSVILIGMLAAHLAPGPAFSAPLKAASTPEKAKPNIVLILADDLDSEAIRYVPKLKTLIADQGVTFPNYFVSMSLCCPSRSTTLRGQYAHNTKILGNSLPAGGFQKFFQLGEEESTITTWLQNAGYRTLLAGKYLNGYPNKDNPMYIPPGWNEWYSAVKGNPYSEYNYTLNENGKQAAYGNKPQDYGTDVYVGKTVDFIKRASKEGKPFFIYLAPYAPHAPYTPAPRHADLFPGAQAPRTPTYDEADVSGKPDYIRNRPLLRKPQQTRINEAYRKRLQALQAVDEGIEAIVNTLKDNGQLENTYLFFTSDNGYHLGNHRQVLGKISPYQEELRVTMIVRGPGVPAGQTREQLAVNIDLAPTWAELAGAKTPQFVDGRSLVPLMGNNPPGLSQWRQEFAIENGPERDTGVVETLAPTTDQGLLEPQDQDQTDTGAVPARQRRGLAIPYFRGIRLQTWSYVEYVTGEKELYDVRADPYQLHNLAGKEDPRLLAELSARVRDMMTCKAAACRTLEDAPFNPPL